VHSGQVYSHVSIDVQYICTNYQRLAWSVSTARRGVRLANAKVALPVQLCVTIIMYMDEYRPGEYKVRPRAYFKSIITCIGHFTARKLKGRDPRYIVFVGQSEDYDGTPDLSHIQTGNPDDFRPVSFVTLKPEVKISPPLYVSVCIEASTSQFSTFVHSSGHRSRKTLIPGRNLI
jgi:hypothetical protein